MKLPAITLPFLRPKGNQKSVFHQEVSLWPSLLVPLRCSNMSVCIFQRKSKRADADDRFKLHWKEAADRRFISHPERASDPD
jgi:hypothetical protein